MAAIDAIDQLTPADKADKTPLQQDAATLLVDVKRTVYQVSYHLRAIRERAGRHGMMALLAELTAAERTIALAVITQGQTFIRAVGKNHDVGPLPDDPDPVPEPEPEPEP